MDAADSVETYDIRTWATLFRLNDKGNIVVHPNGPDGPTAT